MEQSGHETGKPDQDTQKHAVRGGSAAASVRQTVLIRLADSMSSH